MLDGRKAVVEVAYNPLQLADHVMQRCDGACQKVVTGGSNSFEKHALRTSKLIGRDCICRAIVEVVYAQSLSLLKSAKIRLDNRTKHRKVDDTNADI